MKYWAAGLALSVGAILVHAQVSPKLATATVASVSVVPGSEKGAKQRIRELSGLEWDARQQRLLAVSDRGWLFTLKTDAATPAVDVVVRRELAEQRVDAEALCLDHAGQLHIADEKAAELLRVAPTGSAAATRGPLPGPLSAPESRQKPNSGVEALACHERYGVIAAPQRALEGDGSVHMLYASGGRQWAFRADPAGKSTVKALHLIDGQRLLVLEKVATDPLHRTVLRELDLNACPIVAPCNPPVLVVQGGGIEANDNFEGLACRDDTHCWLVSDGDANDGTRTVLAQVTLARQ